MGGDAPLRPCPRPSRPAASDEFVGSIDQGTTSTRFVIFNSNGEPAAIHQMGFENIHPQSGWHEHDPNELLSSVETCIRRAAEKFTALGHGLSQIRAVGVTNQRETTVLWDKHTGEPLCNAVVWPDTRTRPLVRELKAKDGADKLLNLCGLPLSTYPSSVKLVWLLRNNDAVKTAYQEGRLAFGTIDTWLIFKLNGGVSKKDGEPVYVTDPTNASRTMFMNLSTLRYDDTLLSFFDIDPRKVSLPEIVPSSHPTKFGTLATGPLKGVPIAGCLGDQSSALVGQLGFRPGQAKNTYGTGCFLLYNVGARPVISKSGLLATVAYDFGDGNPVYALEGSIAVAGSGVSFLLNNLGLIEKSKDIDEVALSVPDNGGVYFVTAFSGLFAPYWYDDVKGTVCMRSYPGFLEAISQLSFLLTIAIKVGLTAHSEKGHIARATLEAVCHQTAAILDAMAQDSGSALTSLAVDGGLSDSDLCMQTQADLSGIRVHRPAMRETTSLGAAIAAGLATGVWSSVDDLEGINSSGRTMFEPKIGENERTDSRRMWERAVDMCRGWTRDE